ncbi:MAG: OmpA family protein [Gammaproteobacteria bacterium]|nr:OmpA family protein [Gammaproteobacteria bacterium]
MKLANISKVMALSAMALLLAACSSNKNQAPEGAYAGAQTAGLGNNEPFVSADYMAKTLGVNKNTVYFDYDKTFVKSDYGYLIQANANYLKSHPSAKVRLEGNTDPTGSREYNIGLGQRRADQVAQQLELQGVSSQQLITVSYGQERPAILGDSQQAYQADRRVDIVYMSK